MIFDDETPQEDHADLFLRAVNLYGEITGVPVPQHENDGRFGKFTFSSYDIRRNYDHLRDAIDLDPSTLTANLMLSYFVRTYLAEQKLSLLSLMDDPAAYLSKVVKPKELLDIVNREDVVAARDGFIARLSAAVGRYGAGDRDDVKKVLTNTDQIAFLRRDALKGAQRMQMHQFLDGEPEAADVLPVYHQQVFQWWNINSLLAAAVNMPSGVSLNLIRDKDEYQSYFCWCIRNGGRLMILTDAPVFAHPLQGSMTRRPDRALGERSVQAWFPYDLLGLKWDEEAERYYVEKSDHMGLAVYQQEHKVLKPMAEIGAEELLWSVMMLDQIVERFWTKGETAKQLSYTGEMLKIEDKLIAKASTSLMKVGDYEPLSLPALTVKDVRTENLDPEHIGKMGSGRHDWMERRYGDKVNPVVLNTVAQAGTILLGPTQAAETYGAFSKKVDHALIEGGIKSISSAQANALGHFGERDLRQGSLVFFDSTKFGTREQIEADRVWLARHNYSTEIARLAYEEFEQTKDKVEKWVKDRMLANLPNLLALVGHEKLWIGSGLGGTFDQMGGGGGSYYSVKVKEGWLNDEKSLTFRQFMSIRDINEERRTKDYDYSIFGSTNLGTHDERGNLLCVVNRTRATYRVKFVPTTAADLAFLCGCEVSDLPEVIQHWQLGKQYAGNHILNRIDPLEWAIGDPWRKLSFRPIFGLSIRGRAKAEKTLIKPTLAGVIDPDAIKAAGGMKPYIDMLAAQYREENPSEKNALDTEDEMD